MQLCQHLQPVSDTPESPPSEDQGQRDIFRPYDLPNSSTAASYNNLPNASAVADGLRSLTLHPHREQNEWVTGCSVCGKSFEQVIKETVADYLNQAAQPGETVRDHQIKNAFTEGIQSGVFNFFLRECHRLPLMMAQSTLSTTTGKRRTCRVTRCPYLKITTDDTFIKYITV